MLHHGRSDYIENSIFAKNEQNIKTSKIDKQTSFVTRVTSKFLAIWEPSIESIRAFVNFNETAATFDIYIKLDGDSISKGITC